MCSQWAKKPFSCFRPIHVMIIRNYASYLWTSLCSTSKNSGMIRLDTPVRSNTRGTWNFSRMAHVHRLNFGWLQSLARQKHRHSMQNDHERGLRRVFRLLSFTSCSRYTYSRGSGGVGKHQTTVSCAQETDPELQEHRIVPPSVICKGTIVAFSPDHGTF